MSQRARPRPGTGKGAEGRTEMRQRVIELELGRLIRDEQRGVYGMDR